ncbi:MAG: GGDEF domain-containing protein [Candidatus Omnitrophica bacterium]|nr:GGDEF domain-containing protein [Candidatus Omnitrophota bacterium]
MAGFYLIVPALAAYCAAPVVFVVLGKALIDRKRSFTEEVADSEKILRNLEEKNKGLIARHKALEERISEISGLYEITKNMSQALLFEDIFRIFSEFIKKNFRFRTCRLSLSGSGTKAQEKVYEVKNAGGGMSAADFRVPLKSRNQAIGAVDVEGLEEVAVDKFLIVARQFSLQIDKARLYKEIQELAITDGVTGIFVRRYFIGMLAEEFERSFKSKFRLSYLMVDLDHFKDCNDRFGHLFGDMVLKEVARVLKQNIREIDLIGRYGGEEFSILLPETDKAGAVLAAERLREAVARQNFMIYNESLKITISIGVSTFPDNAKTIAELMESADKALYAAKTMGRNKVIQFSGEGRWQ